jgi:hypothetical protein
VGAGELGLSAHPPGDIAGTQGVESGSILSVEAAAGEKAVEAVQAQGGFKVIERIKKWLRRRERSVDMTMVWPQFRALAPTLEIAREAFFQHISGEEAWTKDYPVEVLRVLANVLV